VLPFALLLASLGGVLAYVALGLGFTLVLLAYAGLTLLYTWLLKRIAFIDVLALAMLYTLRVVAGAVGAELSLSSWLVAVSLFVFLSLALVKRCTELEFWVRSDEEETHTAMPGRGYQMSDLSYLVSMGISSGFVAVLVLALYVDSPNVALLYRTPEYLWGICPLFLYWLMRIWILVSRQEMKDDPVHFALGDRVSWFILLAFAVLFGLAL
jgi:4-hydroxybenzoate polyprenyltransferase